MVVTFLQKPKMVKEFRSTLFTYFYKFHVLLNSADIKLFSYNNLMFQDGIQSGCSMLIRVFIMITIINASVIRDKVLDNFGSHDTCTLIINVHFSAILKSNFQ